MSQVKFGSIQWSDLVQVGPVSLTTDVSGVLPVANGGTGSGSFTDGQLLIGKTTGNTLAKATLTATANQTTVTNGSGTITIGTVQDIGTASTPTFSTLTLSSQLDTPSIVHAGTIDITPTSGNDVNINTASGAYLHVQSTLGAGIKLQRSTTSDAGTSLVFNTGGTNKWAVGPQGDGTENYKLFNNTAGVNTYSVNSSTNVMTITALAATNAVLTTPDIGTPSAGTLTNCTGLPVAGGGTGQSTYTNGQLLIGNTTGNTLTKATLTGTSNQVVVTNGAGSITLSLPQNIHTGASPTFTGLNLSSTLTNVCTTQLALDLSRSGAGNLEFKLINSNTANFVAFNFGEVYGSKQGTMYYFGAGYSPSGQYMPNSLLIECLTSTGTLGLSYPSNGTFQVYAQSGTARLHMDSSGNVTVGASAHSLARIESRLTTAPQFAASYDASNYSTWQTASTGATTFAATRSGGSADFTFSNTTDSTSSTTGTIVCSGGAVVSKNLLSLKGQGWGVTSTATAAGTTTLTSTSTIIQVFTGSTTQTVTLPAANLFGAGVAVVFIIKNRSSGTVTINRAGSDTIDGGTSTTLTGGSNQSVTLASDGVSAWEII